MVVHEVHIIRLAQHLVVAVLLPVVVAVLAVVVVAV
jgi:hypothetical protein